MSELRETISGRFLLDRGRDVLSSEEIAVLEAAFDAPRKVAARTTMVRRDEDVVESTILIAGTMCRYLDDRKGNRQLLGVHIAGDFVDLHGFPLERLDHDVATISDCVVASVPRARLAALVARYPRLTWALWRSTMFDAAMHREWIFRLGRLGANGRVAHFFAEMGMRSEMAKLGTRDAYPLAINQTDLAEACGLTSVHVNRTLRQLREAGLALFRNGQVAVLDRDALYRLADFDGVYLFPGQARAPF